MSKVKSQFTRIIEIARARSYDVRKLLESELTDKPYFLTPDGKYLSKGKKSELQKLLKTRTLSISADAAEVYKDPSNSIVLFDFMAEARKIASRRTTFNLKTYGDAMNDMWINMFAIGKHARRSRYHF